MVLNDKNENTKHYYTTRTLLWLTYQYQSTQCNRPYSLWSLVMFLFAERNYFYHTLWLIIFHPIYSFRCLNIISRWTIFIFDDNKTANINSCIRLRDFSPKWYFFPQRNTSNGNVKSITLITKNARFCIYFASLLQEQFIFIILFVLPLKLIEHAFHFFWFYGSWINCE